MFPAGFTAFSRPSLVIGFASDKMINMCLAAADALPEALCAPLAASTSTPFSPCPLSRLWIRDEDERAWGGSEKEQANGGIGHIDMFRAGAGREAGIWALMAEFVIDGKVPDVGERRDWNGGAERPECVAFEAARL